MPSIDNFNLSPGDSERFANALWEASRPKLDVFEIHPLLGAVASRYRRRALSAAFTPRQEPEDAPKYDLRAIGCTRQEIAQVERLEAMSEAKNIPVYDILDNMSRHRRSRRP